MWCASTTCPRRLDGHNVERFSRSSERVSRVSWTQNYINGRTDTVYVLLTPVSLYDDGVTCNVLFNRYLAPFCINNKNRIDVTRSGDDVHVALYFSVQKVQKVRVNRKWKAPCQRVSFQNQSKKGRSFYFLYF